MSYAKVAGVGMVKFTKPSENDPYRCMASAAIELALIDAGISYTQIQQAYASYVYGDSTSGQHALYDVGMTGIPIINVNNNCSSGSSALYLARQTIASGALDCVLAFGFEEMRPGKLESQWNDRESPFDPMMKTLTKVSKAPDGPLALRMFGQAGTNYIERYGANPNIFGKVSVKSRRHAKNNPYAVFTADLSLEDVMSSPVIYEPYLTRFMACPPTCGAAAVVLCSDRFARKNGITGVVEIVAQSMTTDIADSWTDPINLVGAQMTKVAANEVYETSGIGPDDIQVIELHDCFTTNEVISYESLGLCAEGEAEKFIADGNNTYGGRFVVNPSGGLMSKGHPLGATGLAQCSELVWHLRDSAGKRQVEGAQLALQHNIGLGGAAVVTMYRKSN